jgi:hypothetical protein
MSETAVRISENSPEYVALLLLELIANVERKSLEGKDPEPGFDRPDRSWILNTYTECLNTVRLTPRYPDAAVELNP